MENSTPYTDKINPTYIVEWFKSHKKQLLIALVVVTVGMVLLNQVLDFRFKAQLLADPCVECVARGYKCTKDMLSYFNFTLTP
jgi:hypothetical protein